MGFFTIPLAKMVGNDGCVIAVDLQQRMLDVLVKRAERAGVANRIRAYRCERDSIGIHESVDFVLAFWSAHEAPDLRRLLEELHGCLVNGGRLLVAEPRGHISAKTFGQLVATAQEVGFLLGKGPAIQLSRTAMFVTK
jgi:ubiquinone/menaquinone biosynthesis C-methylase UbiE